MIFPPLGVIPVNVAEPWRLAKDFFSDYFIKMHPVYTRIPRMFPLQLLVGRGVSRNRKPPSLTPMA